MLRWLKGRRSAGAEASASAGDSWLDGAYRTHHADDVPQFTALAAEAFPAFAARITCFGADWLGRQFATDEGRIIGGEPQVLMLEPGTGEALEIPVSYTAFHEEELLQQPDAAVAYPFFKKWLADGGARPGYHQCIGYKVPLFLGGADDTTNLELTDFNVYWTIAGQLLAKVPGLPPGTKIGKVSIGD